MEATYDQLVARIAANIKDSNQIPQVGEVLPDFRMTNSEGTLVELATLLAKGPLVVSFNRGPWCDYCGLELHSLARAYPEIVAAGGDVIGGFGIDLAHFQGNGGWFLPVPATLVVGRDGRVKARFVDPDFRHRMRTEDIVEAVRKAAQA